MMQRTLNMAAAIALIGLLTCLGRADAQAEKSSKTPEAKGKEIKTATKPPEVALLRLHGDLEEGAGSEDPLLGAFSESFKHVVDRIAKARQDSQVQALIVQLDGLAIGWGKVNELRKALEEFRKTGKKVYAYVEGGEAKDFLVGCAADRIVMPPSGWLMLVGTRAEISFYKELLEKLGIRADFLQMGVFKFAAEPLTRTSMSKEAREQYEKVLGDFYEFDYVRSISRSRRGKGSAKAGELTEERVKQLIDEGPYTASKAAAVGLIDDVIYRDEIMTLLKKDLQAQEVKIVADYGKSKLEDLDLSNPFAVFKLFAPRPSATGSKKDRIALIYAVGPIVTGKGAASIFGGSTVGSTTMIDAIRQAEKDPKVKAIVLRVDSPGGSALASDLIWHELKRCKKPVIASMSDVAASGGYYISVAAKKIYAEPGTLTGSIGVVGGKIVLGGLFDKIGVHTEVLSYGKNSGILSSSHPFTPSERKSMEALMAEVYDQFLQKTIEGRAQAGLKFTREQLLKYAEGRIWSGRQAQERGLIDALGTLEDAIADAKQMGGLARDADVDYLILPKAHSFVETLLERGSASAALAASELARTRELRHVLRDVDGLLQLRSEPVWVMMPHSVRVR
jgi:protease-4